MQRILKASLLYVNKKAAYWERMKIMMNLKKSNVITAIICAATLSTVSFYTGVSAAGSSVSYKSQGKIVFDNNTDDTADDVVFDASDFKTISNMVVSGKKQIGAELNKYPSVNFNLSSSIPDFADLANAVDILTDDTTDTTSDKILKDYTAYVKGNKIKGAIPSKVVAAYTPGRSDQTIAAGQYLSGAQTIKGDQNLTAANIISGKTIFGVQGSAQAESHTIEANKSVNITSTSGSITPSSGNNAMSAVTYFVSGIDASKIISGQSILGVAGSAAQESHTEMSRSFSQSEMASADVTIEAGQGITIPANQYLTNELTINSLNNSSGEGVSAVWGCTQVLTNHTPYTFECGFKPDAVFCFCIELKALRYYDSAGDSKLHGYIKNAGDSHDPCYLKQSSNVGDIPSSTETGLWDLTDAGFKFQWSDNGISSSFQRTYHITAVKYN